MKSISILLVALTFTVAAVGQEGDASNVRPLPFKPADPTFFARHGGQSKVTAIKDLAAAEQVLNKDDAKGLTAGVDFAKDQIVLVSWTTSGPPEGVLKHEVKGTTVTFFVQAPAGAKIRGQRARIGADFFVAPKGLAVAFDNRERP